MKPTLVTGSTGFLGQHLARLLIDRNEAPVRLLCRGASAWDGDRRATVIQGDVTAAGDVDRAMQGAGTVYHLAGLVSRNREDAAKLHAVHVNGTRNVLDAALKAGVSKLVIASTSGTIAVSKEPTVHDESSGYKDRVVRNWPYYVSKIAAERLCWEHHQRNGTPIVVVNPSLLLGPGDTRGSSTSDIKLVLEGQILSLPTGGMSFIDARDCAAAMVGAMERGRIGQRYLLGGVNWTFAEVIRRTAKIAGTSAPFWSSPAWMSLLFAPLLRRFMPFIGKRFDVDDATIEMSGVFWYCSPAKAAAELGLQTRDPLETLADTVAELRK
jgi:dihydroflavonol-4-reductase